MSPELRTWDYSFARPGRDTWTSQGSLGGIATSSRHFSIDLANECLMCTFALWSHADYYGDSVTLGLAPVRPSHVPLVVNVSSVT